jgi:hypothetical protein
MADFGATGANYSPDVLSTGLIGKIAKQVVEGESVPYLFSSLDKGQITTGKDLEIALIKAAVGVDPTADSPDFEKPEFLTRYFKEWLPKVFPVMVDYEDIDDGATNEANAEAQASKIVDSLYQGASKFKNEQAIAAFVAAIAPEAGHITNVGGAEEITNEATANSYLSLVKRIAKKVRRGSPSVNVDGLDIPAERVVMIAPADRITQIDVYKRTATEQLEYARFDVDEVIEYDPDKFSAMNGATIICDERYVQFYEKARHYSERLRVGADNGNSVEAALNVRLAFWLCPLFNAAVITEA